MRPRHRQLQGIVCHLDGSNRRASGTVDAQYTNRGPAAALLDR